MKNENELVRLDGIVKYKDGETKLGMMGLAIDKIDPKDNTAPLFIRLLVTRIVLYRIIPSGIVLFLPELETNHIGFIVAIKDVNIHTKGGVINFSGVEVFCRTVLKQTALEQILAEMNSFIPEIDLEYRVRNSTETTPAMIMLMGAEDLFQSHKKSSGLTQLLEAVRNNSTTVEKVTSYDLEKRETIDPSDITDQRSGCCYVLCDDQVYFIEVQTDRLFVINGPLKKRIKGISGIDPNALRILYADCLAKIDKNNFGEWVDIKERHSVALDR